MSNLVNTFSESIVVGTTATQLGKRKSSVVTVIVPVGGVTVFVGDVNVTTATGFPVAAGGAYSVDFNLIKGNLYGVVASGTQATKVLGHA